MTTVPTLPTRTYTPESPLAHPGKLWQEMVQDLWAGRELAWRLAVRDISAQYRQSVLGVLWALIIPFSTTAVWLFLSASKVVQVGATPVPYPVFVFTGTLLWSILIDALNAPLQQVNANKALLAKINFPREALILSGVYQTLFNAAIKLGILLLVLPFLGVHPGWGGLLIPLGLFSLVLTGTAVGLLLTPLGVLYGDIGRAIPLITQFLMYLSPVVFPLATSGWSAQLMRLNPLTPLILNARAWFTGQPPLLLAEWALAVGSSAILLLLVWMLYRLAMPILIERMSA
ncbi:ABC-type lipopolysaccharide transport system/ permease component [Synechococcus sp. RS9907]|uniref:ABC transporter permease n=1 Tax=Synechococcus sp. RS9907 TaxID=221350 RepID=UPI00165EA221|nr:ABC transporter permease [Synechococcus sp. RS9907]QNI83337.1 ABC-type lipopolysaccharide transport system/ permease component [Synechococcus sp. RS9907]